MEETPVDCRSNDRSLYDQEQPKSTDNLPMNKKAASYEMTLMALVYNEACHTADYELINTPDKSGV